MFDDLGNQQNNQNDDGDLFVDMPREAAPPPQNNRRPNQPRRRPLWQYFVVGGLIVALILTCFGIAPSLPKLVQEDQNGDPVIVLPQFATAAPQSQPQQGDQPANPNQQPVEDLPTLTVCGPSFGAYFSAVLAMLHQQFQHYRLVYLPMEFAVPDPLHPGEMVMLKYPSKDGTKFYTGTESEQPEMMKDGTCDILLNTSDVLALDPSIGSWILDIGMSDGADETVAYTIGVAGCPGKSIGKLNDFPGCTVAISPNSVGQFQILSLLSAAHIDPNSITWLTGYTDEFGNFVEFSVEEACQAFADKKSDAVAGWLPCIEDVQNENTLRIANSTWLRNISDIIIVSPSANINKEDAVFWFLVDWLTALKLQQENLGKAGSDLAAWQFEYTDVDGMDPNLTGIYPTSDWTYVFPNDEVNPAQSETNMHEWLDTYGQAGLDPNLLHLTNEGTLQQRFIDAREIWATGGVQINPQDDLSHLIEFKYLKRLSEYAVDHPEIRPRIGTSLPNTSYTPFQVSPSSPLDAQQLVDLPTILEVNCPQLNYKAGEDTLRYGTPEYESLVACAQNAAKLLSQTKNVVIRITGSAAGWCGYSEPVIKNFALQRANNVYLALNQGAGIPAPYLTIGEPHVGTISCDDAVNQKDRWVRIEFIDTSSLQ